MRRCQFPEQCVVNCLWLVPQESRFATFVRFGAQRARNWKTNVALISNLWQLCNAPWRYRCLVSVSTLLGATDTANRHYKHAEVINRGDSEKKLHPEA
jgi:hypothetical protein